MGDVVVVLAGAGAATDDGSPVSQFWDVSTAAKTSAVRAITPATPAATATSGRRSCDS